MSKELPPAPAGHRYVVTHKRAWTFVELQRKTWYGWRTLSKHDLLEFAK